MVVVDRCQSQLLEFQPLEFCSALGSEFGCAESTINHTSPDYESGCLFVDGPWIREGTAVLMAADFFTADADGLISLLAIPSTSPRAG